MSVAWVTGAGRLSVARYPGGSFVVAPQLFVFKSLDNVIMRMFKCVKNYNIGIVHFISNICTL